MSRILTGQVTISAVAQKLSTDTDEFSDIIIKCPASNVNSVYVGTTGVTATSGLHNDPGETFTFNNRNEAGQEVYDVNLTDIFVVGTAGDKVTWLAFRHK